MPRGRCGHGSHVAREAWRSCAWSRRSELDREHWRSDGLDREVELQGVVTSAATGLGSRILQPGGSRAGIVIGRWTDPREPSEADGGQGDGGEKI
jgi:hypothetical protein